MRFNNTLTVNDECLSLYDAFSLFSLISTSVMVAFSLIGSLVYTRVDDDDIDWYADDDEADTEEEEDSEEYDELYYNELDKLEDRVLEKDDLEKLGNVILRWPQLFWYHFTDYVCCSFCEEALDLACQLI